MNLRNIISSTYTAFFLCLLLVLTLNIQAKDPNYVYSEQDRIIDSLRSVISVAKHLPDGHARDTLICSAYLHLGEELYSGNPDTALMLWQNVREVTERNLASGQAGRPAGLDKKYISCLADALNNIGFVYKDRGDYYKSLEYYHRSWKIYEETGNNTNIAVSLNNIGGIYNKQGDIPKALEYHHRSLKIDEGMGNKEGIATSLNNIGLIYKRQGDIAKALEYYHKSLKIREEIDNKEGIAVSLNNISSIYDDQGDITKALEYYHKSLKIDEEINNKSGIATSLNNIGLVYKKQGDIAKALEYYHKCLKIDEEIGNKAGMAITLNNIGYIELGQGALVRALNNSNRGLIIAREIGSPHLISINSDLLSQVAKKLGNYQEALEMYELHIQMRDSIKNDATQKATIRQQTKYEFEKAQLIKEQQEQEAGRLEREARSRRDNLQYSVILIALLILFGGVLSLGFVKVSVRMAEGIIFFSFLILFEFLLVLADPYIETWSGGAPGIKLLFNAGIAALIFPLHSLFERKLTRRLSK